MQMIVVDELRVWPHARPPFHRGSCHLMYAGGEDIDGDLHAFAARLGLRREWFQSHPRYPHYDLTPTKRQLAVRLGAREVTARQMVRARRQTAEALRVPGASKCMLREVRDGNG
jgi:hypothetical protein